MSHAEPPQRPAHGYDPTVEEVRRLMGASTPHFALQLRERIERLIRDLPSDHPARIMGSAEVRRLEELALRGELRGDGREDDLHPLRSLG